VIWLIHFQNDAAFFQEEPGILGENVSNGNTQIVIPIKPFQTNPLEILNTELT
jgi:hypothetical protein